MTIKSFFIPEMLVDVKKERLVYIDQLKGIAIVIVVMGHFIQYNTNESTNNVLFGIIYSFHMPFFMFISGYVAYKTIREKDLNNYFSFVNKKAVAILIPFFSWPLIVKPYFFNNQYLNNPATTILDLIREPAGGLWFLWFLFWLYLLYTLFLYLSGKLNARTYMLLDIIIFLVGLLPLGLLKYLNVISYGDSFILYYIFFFLGVFISKYLKLQTILLNDIVAAFCMIYFALASRLYDFNEHSTFNLVVKISLSITAIVSIYYLTLKSNWNKRIDYLIQLCGRNSLVIYVTHFSMINILATQDLLTNYNIFVLFILTLLASMLVITACIAIMRIMEKNQILNFVLFGRRK